jgi:hypothetical protein
MLNCKVRIKLRGTGNSALIFQNADDSLQFDPTQNDMVVLIVAPSFSVDFDRRTLKTIKRSSMQVGHRSFLLGSK